VSRVLALDVGDVRIGLAISDELEILARPLEVLKRVPGPASFRRIAAIVAQEGIHCIVVGLPVREDGAHGKQVASTEAYVRGLASHVDVPIVFWDERNTTGEARALLRVGGHQEGRSAVGLDAAAAAVILQDYLNDQREGSR